MSNLLDLPNELLRVVVEYVKPHDIENFTLSCKRLHKLAFSRLIEHQVLKAGLATIESGWGQFPGCLRFPELLDLFLVEHRDADYVSKMIVEAWCPVWGAPFKYEEDSYHNKYSKSRMRAFEEAVKNTESIPSEEKADWISSIRIGDENPVIALLLARLHCLTSIRIELDASPDYFMFKTVKRIVEAPRSLPLSQLREVKINGGLHEYHEWRLATVFAALPSVVSLTARRLVEVSPDSKGPIFEIAPRSSSVRDLIISVCDVSEDAIFKLISSSASLRFFGYSRRSNVDHPSWAWICAAILQCASTSLEKLTLRHSNYVSISENIACSFRSYTNLRVLRIDYGLWKGELTRTRDMMVEMLPASLEVLTLFGCHLYHFEWFKELVQYVVRTKERKLPRLKQLNFDETTVVFRSSAFQIRALRLEALAAGFELTVTRWET